MFRRPSVGDQRVGEAQIGRVANVGLAGQIDDDGNILRAQPRGLVQRMRMDDVGLSIGGCDAPPRSAAEPFLVDVQRGHRQPAEAAAVLEAVHEVARIRRSQHGRVHALEGVPRLPEQRGAGDDVDVDAEPAELVRPGEMPRFAAAPHHREAPHEHRHAHR